MIMMKASVVAVFSISFVVAAAVDQGLPVENGNRKGFSLDAPPCDYSVDMVFAQDKSGSFEPHMGNVQHIFPELIEEMSDVYPGSKFKLVAFTDYNWYPFGCGKNDSPYDVRSEWTDDPEVFRDAINNIKMGWGCDLPEAQLVLLHQLGKLQVFPSETHTPTGRPIKRFIIVSTDAPYHRAGDVLRFDYKLWSDTCNGNWEPVGEKGSCCEIDAKDFAVIPFTGDGVLRYGQDGIKIIEDYPSVEQTAKPLADLDAFVIFTISAGQVDPIDQYYDLAEQLIELGVPTHVVKMEENSANLREAILEGIKALEGAICLTTTPEIRTEDSTTSDTNPGEPGEGSTVAGEPGEGSTVAGEPGEGSTVAGAPGEGSTVAGAPTEGPGGVPGVPPVGVPPEGGDTTTTTSTEKPEVATTTAAAGGVPVVAIGAAAGGAAAAAVAGLLAAKFAGVGAFGGSSPPGAQVMDNMDVPEVVEDREFVQQIPEDMFT